ncbi:scavenger receptor cysteine-rich domain-containing group B protein-like [Salminus brasiliensis]|uniref:scavenger receptor cysteine-rich domain-containing group B protein-like n=1 Tax=Salminus brasiliensis TaxID=930266 RepID=UPI003B82FF45
MNILIGVENKVEIYDDVTPAGESPHSTPVCPPEGYDDVLTPRQELAGVAGDGENNVEIYNDALFAGENFTTENYDDVITAVQDLENAGAHHGTIPLPDPEVLSPAPTPPGIQPLPDHVNGGPFASAGFGSVSPDSVRLVGGGSRCAGRVEVLHRGQWGTVCDDNWDMSDAAVVCRELGCGEAVDALSEAHFGSGSGPIWMDDVDCSGLESTLKNCRSRLWGKHHCSQNQNSGVICSGKKHNYCPDFLLLISCSFSYISGVRLVGGSQCSGRVEVLHNETWVTVCDADFDQQDAEVVCRELGCGLPVEVLGPAAFGRGEGQVWSEELQCRGNESQIHFCPTSSSLKHNCSHDNDVGLVCAGKKCVL